VRLFVAAYPPPAALDHLAGCVARLALGRPAASGRSVRLAPPERWHVTLAFLADVRPDRLDAAVAAVTRAASAGTTVPAGRGGPDPAAGGGAAQVLAGGGADGPAAGRRPTLRLAGGGRFGRGRSTVVWAGLHGDVPALERLARMVRRELRAARLEYDRKPPRPHLTLARPGDRLPAPVLADDLAVLREYCGPEWTLDSIRLVRSELGPNPVHHCVVEVPLAG
jgi:RNA 2',3'-cyclic 3'-phosphodiesterase